MTRFDRPLDMCSLNYFCRSRRPPVQQGRGGGGLGERWGRMGEIGARR